MRIALGIEYDGAAFCGWQTQPGGCGVQDHLHQALARFIGAAVEVTAAGRTDAGVHASAQVVHFDADVQRDENAWVRGTNTSLQESARVQWAREVPGDFHARFSARSRTYRYLLQDTPVAPAIMRNRVGWYHRPLDVDLMAQAARALVGEHDFSAFRSAECQAKSPLRNLLEASVARDRGFVTFVFRANAFLHHMVRNVVGSLVYVGARKQPPEWVGTLLASKDRRLAAPTFAPDGLYLTAVEYDPAFQLPRPGSDPIFPSQGTHVPLRGKMGSDPGVRS